MPRIRFSLKLVLAICVCFACTFAHYAHFAAIRREASAALEEADGFSYATCTIFAI